MYFRQILRTQLCGAGAARLFRPVCRVQVAALKTNLLVLVIVNIWCLLAEAEHLDSRASRPAGGCGEPAEPHRAQVWLAATPARPLFHELLYVLRACLQQLAARNFPFPPSVWGVSLLDPQRPLCTKSDEVRLAEEAAKKYGSPAPTIFSKVIDKTIPADIIYEDEKVAIRNDVANASGN